MTDNKKDSSIFYFELLRSIAILAVVILHSSAPLLNHFDHQYNWWAGNIYDSAMRWSVPIFVMISGALLLNPSKQQSIQQFLKKRISKVLVPFLVWSVLYSVFVWIMKGIKIELSFNLFKEVLMNILVGNSYYHLWFLYMILGLYLITPIIKIYTNHADKRSLEYFLLLWFISTGMFGLIEKFSLIELRFEVPLVTGYIGYFILGHYLHHFKINPISKYSLYVLSVISLLITIWGTYYLTKQNGAFEGYFYSYFSINTILMATSVFIFFSGFRMPKNKKIKHVINHLSATSLGIYLIHPMILRFLFLHNFTAASTNPYVGILLLALATTLINFVIVMILKKIPIIKQIVP